MLATKRSWPGTSTKATSAGRQPCPGEAQVDGQAPAALLGPAGRAPCRSARGPASTCRGRRARRWRSRASAARPSQWQRRSLGPRARVRRSSRQRPCSTRPTTAGRRRAARRRTAPAGSRAALGSSTPGAPPPPTAAVEAHRARHRRRAGSASRRRLAPATLGVGVPAPSRSGGSGPRSVASSAARVSLSTRSARADGMPAQPLDQRRPRRASRPACGPPSSLSPLAVTRAAPARSAVATSGSSGSSGCGASSPRADVDDDAARRGRPARPTARRAGEPRTSEVGRVHLEHERGVRPDRRQRSRRRCVRLVVPTSRSRAPVRRHRSGRRKPSPISTSSPRLITISRPCASAVTRQQQRRGAVVDHVHVAGVGNAPRAARPARRVPRARRVPGGQVELDVDVAGGGRDGRHARPATAAPGPRLVCSDDAGRVEHRRAGPCAGRAASTRRAPPRRRALRVERARSRRPARIATASPAPPRDRGGGSAGSRTSPSSGVGARHAHDAGRRHPSRVRGGGGRESNPPGRDTPPHGFEDQRGPPGPTRLLRQAAQSCRGELCRAGCGQ